MAQEPFGRVAGLRPRRRAPQHCQTIPGANEAHSVSGPESAEQLLRVFRNAGRTPVQIMDARAQATDEILRVIQRTHFLSVAADQGIRMTVFVFPYDDLATMQNLGTHRARTW
jgi:hypothetical protein